MQSETIPASITALYDGDCVICRGARASFQKLDWRRRIHFVDINDQSAWQVQFPSLRGDALRGEIHVIADGAVYGGFAATRRLLREAPLGWLPWALLHLPGMDRLGARLYRFIAERPLSHQPSAGQTTRLMRRRPLQAARLSRL